MDAWDILAIVLCIGVIALVGFLIPILIQVKDLLKMAETTVTRIEKDVEPVLHNVEGITQNFQGITGAANSFVNRKTSGNEPGMVENLKESVKDGVDEVKYHYVPLVSNEARRYLRALTIGFKVAYNKFKHSKENEIPARTLIANKPSTIPSSPMSSQPADDIVIVNHQIIKR